MKRIVLFLSLGVPALVFAQSYQIDWYKIAGGGGTSTAGVYAVIGTISQHDAGGPMTGTVVRVLERKRSRMVGTLQQSKQFLFVIPDDPRIPHDIYVSPPRDAGRPARAPRTYWA